MRSMPIIVVLTVMFACTPNVQQRYFLNPEEVAIGGFEVLYAVENYACSFLSDTSEDEYGIINVSTSRDGITWNSADFPNSLIVELKDISGCGICGKRDGLKLSVVYNDIRGAVWIVEGTVSDSNSVNWSPPNRVRINQANSAPSCVYLQNGLRLVAVRSGDSMKASIYSGGDQFLIDATPSWDNQNTYGHPSIANCKGLTMMAWRRYIPGNQCGDVILAQGQWIRQDPVSIFSFTKHAQLILANNDVTPCAISDPVITSDDKNFYLAVIQEERGGGAGTLHGWQVVSYKSLGSDLYGGWREHERIPLSVHNMTHINLAARETGQFVAAKIKNMPRGSNNELESKLFSIATGWQNIGASPFLNHSSASYRPFGLTRFGINSLPNFDIPGIHYRVPDRFRRMIEK